MQKESGKAVKPVHSNRNLIITIVIIAAVIILLILVYILYNYFGKKIPGGTETPAYVNDTNAANKPEINNTSGPITYICGDGKCNGTENKTNCPKDCKTGGGGGGGGGGGTPATCATGAWIDTTEYGCNASGEREIKQTRTICPSGTEEQWIAAPCSSGYICSYGSCVELANCTADDNCTYVNGTCGLGFCNPTTGKCQAGYNLTTDVCRNAAGECDMVEKCSGESLDCPPDAFNLSTNVCRQNISECDATDYCTGDSATCSLDENKKNGEKCSIGSCQGGKCSISTQPVEISRCMIINQPGNYYLSQNIQGYYLISTFCILINSNNVELDCRNNTIDGLNFNDAEKGIYINYSNNVQIKNCHVNDYWYGMKLERSNNIEIINLTSTGNLYAGLDSLYSNNILLQKTDIYSNDYDGAFISEGDNNSIIDCYFGKNGYYGLTISNADNDKIVNSEISESSDNGLAIYSSKNIFILNSSMKSNKRSGIYIDSSQNITVERIISNYNLINGLKIYKSNNLSVTSSTFCGNGVDCNCDLMASNFTNNICNGHCGGVLCSLNCSYEEIVCTDKDSDGYYNLGYCPGSKGEDCNDSNSNVWRTYSTYEDQDQDGYGNRSVKICIGNSVPAGYASNYDDCNDSNKDINPSAGEACDGIDNNCNNKIDYDNLSCPPKTVYIDDYASHKLSDRNIKYMLNSSVQINSSKNFVIFADFSELDCQGHNIYYDGGNYDLFQIESQPEYYGGVILGATNFTIKNCNIYALDNPEFPYFSIISVQDTYSQEFYKYVRYIKIINNTFHNTSNTIDIYLAWGTEVIDNKFDNTGFAVYDGGINSRIINNDINNCKTGISISNGDGKALNHSLYNNYINNCSEGIVTGKNSSVLNLIANNTIVYCDVGYYPKSGYYGSTIYNPDSLTKNFVCYNNLNINCTVPSYSFSENTCTGSCGTMPCTYPCPVAGGGSGGGGGGDGGGTIPNLGFIEQLANFFKSLFGLN